LVETLKSIVMISFSSILDKRRLNKEEANQLLLGMTSGHYSEAQVASILTVFLVRGIGLEELRGFQEAMLSLCIPVDIPEDTLDVCGTGGDGKNTFNVSTISAFVLASAGQKVTKHGNYGVSSVCGSSDVVNYLGISFQEEVNGLKGQLEASNLCFLHAPHFHPAMKSVAPIRRALEVKTFFNMLGPLVNPARPQFQMMGVFNLDLARKVNYIFQSMNKQYAVIHSLDGYDEISLTGPFKVYTHVGEYIYEPSDLGLKVVSPGSIRGGEDIASSAEIFLNILEGKGTESQNAVVAANAGMALFCCDKVPRPQDGVELALELLKSGKAFQTFSNLKNYNS